MKLYHTLRYYVKKFASYHISTYAASATFFAISAMIPVLILMLAVVGHTPFGTETVMEMLSGLIPSSFRGLFQALIRDFLAVNPATLSVSILAVIWTAGKSMLGLVDGLNAIAEVNDTRNFVLKRMVCILYMLVLILLVVLNLALSVFGQWILTQLGIYAPHVAGIVEFLLRRRELMLFAAVTVVLVLIYTVFPGKSMRFYMQIPGAILTALGWTVCSALFSFYVEHFPSVSVLYGSLGVPLMAMLWLYVCMYIIFLGAVVNRMYPALFWKGYVIFKYRRALKEKDKVFLPEE